MKTIDIKGKSYVMVNERIGFFRKLYPDGQIVTEMIKNDNGVCIFKAMVCVDGEVAATGHAYEKEGSTFINKTSYIENCETSAIGRALGIFGIGIDTSVASAEEVGNAIKQQKKPPQSDFLTKMKGFATGHPEIYKTHLKSWGVKSAKDIRNPESQVGIIEEINKLIDNELL